MIKYGNKDLRKRWKGNVNINTIHLGTTNIWPYITNVNYGDWKVNISTNTIPASGGTITVTSITRNIVYTWVNFVGTTNTRYTTAETETITDFTLSSSIGSVSGHNVIVPYNPNTSDRNVVITVTLPTGGQVQATVVQAKNVITYSAWNLTLSVSPTSIPSSGGTATITSSCTRTYNNSNGQPGGTETSAVTLSTNVGSISGNTLTIPANDVTSNKTITVTASSQGLTKTAALTQAAKDEVIENPWILKINESSISGEMTFIKNGKIWFEDTQTGDKLVVDTLISDVGKIYSFEGDTSSSPNPTQTKFVWHGLANVSNASKTITLTATNTSKNLSDTITIEHKVPRTTAYDNYWYLQITNFDGQDLNITTHLAFDIVAMKQGVVPQNGQTNLVTLMEYWTGDVFVHNTEVMYDKGGMMVNSTTNSNTTTTVPDGSVVEFYRKSGSTVASTTYTKIGQMVVDSTKSKTLDCITGKVYPDDFV